MAGAQRKPDPALRGLLEREGARFSFFAAIQLLHRLSPGSIPIGELGPVDQEPVRFRHDWRLVFNPGDVMRIEINGQPKARALMTSTFLGLTGSASPLGAVFCEDVINAEVADERSVSQFYDLFHHRLLSLFYRAWKKYRFPAGFRVGAQDAFTRRSLAFVGVDLEGAVPGSGLPPLIQLSLAPLLSTRARTPRTLRIVLTRLFPGATVRIENFVRRSVRIPEPQQVQLGVRYTTLNRDYTIGRNVVDRSGRFRVHVGPVGYSLYEALMPGGQLYPTLRQVVEQFTRGVLECELELELAGDDSPRYCLGSERGATLGVTTQLASQRREQPLMRVVLSDRIEDAKPRAVRPGEE